MDLQLKGRRALVTGASRGIGRTIAETLAAEGADVAVCARGEAGVKETVAALQAMGVKAYGEALDSRDPAAMAAFVQRSAAELGGLDHVVSNVSTRPEHDGGEERWRESFEVDLLQHVRLAELTLPHLTQRAGASMVFIASLAAHTKELLQEEVAYGAFKSGLINYAGNLSNRFGHKCGLRVNCISPGPIYHTGGVWDVYERERPKLFQAMQGLSVLHRLGTTEEVANATVFLLSPAAGYITGTNLRVDGGMDKSVNY